MINETCVPCCFVVYLFCSLENEGNNTTNNNVQDSSFSCHKFICIYSDLTWINKIEFLIFHVSPYALLNWKLKQALSSDIDVSKRYRTKVCFTEPQMQDICLKHESEQSNDQGYNLGILKTIVALPQTYNVREAKLHCKIAQAMHGRGKVYLSPRYWYTSTGQYQTILAFQYCKLLNNTSTF